MSNQGISVGLWCWLSEHATVGVARSPLVSENLYCWDYGLSLSLQPWPFCPWAHWAIRREAAERDIDIHRARHFIQMIIIIHFLPLEFYFYRIQHHVSLNSLFTLREWNQYSVFLSFFPFFLRVMGDSYFILFFNYVLLLKIFKV